MADYVWSEREIARMSGEEFARLVERPRERPMPIHFWTDQEIQKQSQVIQRLLKVLQEKLAQPEPDFTWLKSGIAPSMVGCNESYCRCAVEVYPARRGDRQDEVSPFVRSLQLAAMRRRRDQQGDADDASQISAHIDADDAFWEDWMR